MKVEVSKEPKQFFVPGCTPLYICGWALVGIDSLLKIKKIKWPFEKLQVWALPCWLDFSGGCSLVYIFYFVLKRKYFLQ